MTESGFQNDAFAGHIVSKDVTRVSVYRTPALSPYLIHGVVRRFARPAVRKKLRPHQSRFRPRLTLLKCRFNVQLENLRSYLVPCPATTRQPQTPFLVLSSPICGPSKRICHMIRICLDVSLAWTRLLCRLVTILFFQIRLLSHLSPSASAKPSMICQMVSQMYRAAFTTFLLKRIWKSLIITRVQSHDKSHPSQSYQRRILPTP